MTKKASTLIQHIRRKLSLIDNNVVMRSDFERMGGYEQVGRAIRELVKKYELVRMGYGIYAKTKNDENGEHKTVASFESLGIEALSRLNVKVAGFTKDNNSELIVHLHKKITRQLSIKDIHTKYIIHNKDYNFEEMLWKAKRKQQSDCREQQLNGQKSIEDV